MKRSWLLALLMAGSLVALNSTAFAQDATSSNSTDAQEDVNSALGSLANRVSDVEKKQSMEVAIHGFAEFDGIFDTAFMGLGSETIGDSAQIPKLNSPYNTSGEAQFSPRNSRFDFLAKTNVDGWTTSGYIEADFLGVSNTAEKNEYTAPTLRLRHAYLDAQDDGWDIMAGQYWTLFGWNMDNVLSTLDVTPIMGSLYERTPRIGVMKTVGDDAQVQIAVDAERPEQALSGVPNFNGGIRFKLMDLEAQFCNATAASKLVPLSVGISGRLATYTLPTAANAGTTAVNGPLTDVTGQGLALDVQVPVLTSTASNVKNDCTLILCGEWMIGYGVADVLNGWNGGGATTPDYFAGTGNLDQGLAGVEGAGANAAVSLIGDQSWTYQLQFHLPQSIGTMVTAGYGEAFSNNARIMAGSSYNDVNGMFANVMQDFTDSIRAGIEYSRFEDAYFTGGAVDHRLQLSTWYRF